MASTQQVKFRDPEEVWKIFMDKQTGKETPLDSTTIEKLELHKDKYPEIWEAVDKPDGLKDRLMKYVYSQGSEGEEKPTAEVGEYIIGVKYFDESGTLYVNRRPKNMPRSGGYRPAPLLTLEKIEIGDITAINKILEEQKAGEVYRFSEVKDGKVTVLKLKQVN